jgi:hypothetical protein
MIRNTTSVDWRSFELVIELLAPQQTKLERLANKIAAIEMLSSEPNVT